MNKLIELISNEISIPKDRIEELLRHGKKRHRTFTIKKRNGDDRSITQPTAELKMIQYWLIENIFSKCQISNISTAFHKDASIHKNATIHRTSKYSVRIDLKDFFHSITINDLARIISKNSNEKNKYFSTEELIYVINNACFDNNDTLPIGYPSSPIISNIVMKEIDEHLLSIITSDVNTFGHCRLSRYADDFVFSTDKAGACNNFTQTLKKTLHTTLSPKLKINQDKTRYMSRGGGSTIITGLRIDYNGKVRMHSNQKSHVRLLMKLYQHNRLSENDVPKLVGYLAYTESIDPEFFTNLSHRYYQEITRIRNNTKKQQ